MTGLTIYGVGMIFGAGIYSVIGTAAGKAQEGLWISFAISAFVVLLTALSYAELVTRFPEAGAEFIYLRNAFPKVPSVGFVVSMLVALSNIATAATVSLAFAGYFNKFVSFSPAVVAYLLLATMAGIAIVGIRESSWLTIVFTLIEGGGLIYFIFLGATKADIFEGLSAPIEWSLLPAAALVFFSFLGFENIANLAEEAKKPEKDVPKAILLSIFISTVIYILVGLAAVALLSPELLSKSSSPLATAAAKASPGAGTILAAIALFATANTALIALISTSRIFFSMARKGELPKVFEKTLSKRKTPWSATLLAFVIGMALLPLGKVETVASVSSLVSLVAFMGVNIGLIIIRINGPKAKPAFKVQPSIGKIPLPPLLAILTLGILTTLFEPIVYAVAGIAITVLFGFRTLRQLN